MLSRISEEEIRTLNRPFIRLWTYCLLNWNVVQYSRGRPLIRGYACHKPEWIEPRVM